MVRSLPHVVAVHAHHGVLHARRVAEGDDGEVGVQRQVVADELLRRLNCLIIILIYNNNSPINTYFMATIHQYVMVKFIIPC